MRVMGLREMFNRAPVPFVPKRDYGPYNLPFLGRPNDKESQLASYGSVGTLFSIVSRLAESTSMVDWNLWRSAKSGKDEDRIQQGSHLALDRWNMPNPHMTGQEFREGFLQHLRLVGEAWIVVVRSEMGKRVGFNAPQELWYVRPDRMIPIPDREEFIKGYIYLGPEGERIPLQLDEVIPIKMPNPLDPYRGMGPISAIATDLDSSKYAAEWNRRFFLNSAEPGAVVEIDRSLGDTELDDLIRHWDEQHKGIRNAHRVAFLENGKYVPRGYSMRDMQFAELRKVSSEVIREAYGYPKAMLGTVDDVNRANAEANEVVFGRWHVVPGLERMKSALNFRLLPMFGTAGNGFEFDYVNPVPEDKAAENEAMTSKTNAFKTLVEANVEAAEAAKVVGLPEMRMAPAPTKAQAPTTARETVVVQNYMRGQTPEFEDAALKPADPGDEPKEVWEEELDRLMVRFGDIQEAYRDEIHSQIKKSIDDKNLGGLSSIKVSTSKSTNTLHRALIKMARYGAEHVQEQAAKAGKDITVVVPPDSELKDVARATVNLMAEAYTNAAAKEALRVRGRGSTGQEVADAVEEHLNSLSERFLRDQLGGALWGAEHAGKTDTLLNEPATYYVANEVRDKNICTPCKKLDGKKFTSLSKALKAYPNGGYHLCDGGIRCRGTFDPVWEEED